MARLHGVVEELGNERCDDVRDALQGVCRNWINCGTLTWQPMYGVDSTTSSADTSMNVRSETPERTVEKFGSGAPSVAAWILATFSEKN